MASSSRGKFPPKFNGMIWSTGGDTRAWGAQHWYANLSCYYEAIPASTRYELMDPVFDMYSGAHENCTIAAQQEWGSQGAYIPETMYFDGLERMPDDIAAEMRDPICCANLGTGGPRSSSSTRSTGTRTPVVGTGYKKPSGSMGGWWIPSADRDRMGP